MKAMRPQHTRIKRPPGVENTENLKGTPTRDPQLIQKMARPESFELPTVWFVGKKQPQPYTTTTN